MHERSNSDGSSATQATDDMTIVDILTDLQTRVKEGTISGNQLLTYIEENVAEWIEAAKTEVKTSTGKHAHTDQYSLFNNFLLQRFIVTLVDTNKSMTQEQLAVIRGGPISYNGEPWCVLGWKGRGIFLPMLGAPLVYDFIVQSILNTKAQFAWTLRDIRHFFQVTDVLSTFQIDAAAVYYDRKVGGPCKTNVFLSVEQQGRLFAAIDAKCRVGADDEVTHDDIVGRICAIAELYGKDYEWERVFTRSSEDIVACGTEIMNDDEALEAVLGPQEDWYFGDAEAFENARHSPAATEIDLGPPGV
ncbi:hypothetical protein B0T11DRAFT_294755 [Plectosphaerella cucumerina]|uniref:Uncharacterized protein n=1 Tax=Plectosphaerella cucumerina TaxID=40658 RepID=A0A8K0TLS0_9PEZI|nr:hypothetical protein B0T11DRAFT_294755 [Plectosphaerella cucumerina]